MFRLFLFSITFRHFVTVIKIVIIFIFLRKQSELRRQIRNSFCDLAAAFFFVKGKDAEISENKKMYSVIVIQWTQKRRMSKRTDIFHRFITESRNVYFISAQKWVSTSSKNWNSSVVTVTFILLFVCLVYPTKLTLLWRVCQLIIHTDRALTVHSCKFCTSRRAFKINVCLELTLIPVFINTRK